MIERAGGNSTLACGSPCLRFYLTIVFIVLSLSFLILKVRLQFVHIQYTQQGGVGEYFLQQQATAGPHKVSRRNFQFPHTWNNAKKVS